jgi:uncharacterized protein
MIFKIDEIYGEGLDFDVIESKQLFGIDSPDCSLTEDVKVRGKLEITGQEVLCQGLLESSLSVTCSRCLANFSFPVKNKLRVHFIPRSEDVKLGSEVELTDLDVEQEFYEEGQINLSSSVRDLILLSLPHIRLCKKDCAGLCPQCGTNLNENDCSCEKQESYDPRLAVLQQLKDKLK